MKRNWMKTGLTAFTAAGLLLGGTISGNGMPVANAAKSVTLSGQAVGLTGGSLSIRDAHFLMQDKGKLLAYTVMITNKSSRSMDLLDYWIRVKSKSGKSFKATVIEGDKEKTSVPANSTQYLTYYAVVDSATKLTDLSFDIIKWDFSSSNYEKRLGTISYPSQGTDKIAAFQPGIMVYGSGKLKGAVKQAYISKDKDNGYVTINYLLENVGQQVIDLSKLSFNIQTESLSVYNVSSPSLETMTIQPRERKIITLRSTLPLAVVAKPLTLVPSLNDEATKIKLPTGVFRLPSLKVQAASTAGQPRSIYVEGQPITTKAGNAIVSQDAEGQSVALDFSLTNAGTTAVAAGTFDFYLVTENGKSYALSYAKEENSSLLPGIGKSLALMGTLPADASLAKAELVMKSQATDKEKSYVIASYIVKTASLEGGLGTAFSYKDYSIQLKTVTRTSGVDQDKLVAGIAITNNSAVAKQVPALGGYFMVNGVKIGSEQKALGLDSALVLAPGASYEAVVAADIPYSTTISQIAFVATEAATDKPGKMLYQFTGQQLSEIPVLGNLTDYVIAGSGRKATFKLKRNAVYKGVGTQTFYAEFEGINEEARAAGMAKLGGYLVDKNGLIVPVTYGEVKERISSKGKALISAWTTLPRAFDASDFKLVMGQAIATETTNPPSGENGGSGTGTGGNSSPSSGTSPLLVKPVSYQMGQTSESVASQLKELQVGGFGISMAKTSAFYDVKDMYSVAGLKLETVYSLERDATYEAIAGTHKLKVEFVNQDTNQLTYSKTFDLASALEGSQDEVLKEGTDIPLKMLFNDPEIQNKVRTNSKFKVNLYDVFQGSSILIASQEMNWFLINN
ncbi:hypothetical protein HGI30_21215 [Paenibacillus albicereus]|uniref:Uncharacterized protein n=1 Tax=Paenibacillus albicereus TaxID=2726185 RepID=A0A6H2H270_9BACL|nr:hypothetical protein [Paenibacillus albicereus]QJC53794.1 hypothetical protein HGI30_21215 [Paenibacillus albicereus]